MNLDENRIRGLTNNPAQIVTPGGQQPQTRHIRQDADFGKVLDSARGRTGVENEVKISAHAAQRLMQRGISLDRSDMAKIADGVDRAAAKGARESLFLLRDLALVVSVTNRTVITALHGESAKENVFTNIDSAVLL